LSALTEKKAHRLSALAVVGISRRMSSLSPAPSIIEAGRTERHYWKDLWRYRELFLFLAWRDFLVRYKQTAIGIAWALIQPLLPMLIFTAFGAWLKIPTGHAPRAVFVFTALLPWQFFSASLSAASNSVVSNSNLISKVYFPRLIVPLSAVVTSLVDFLISAVFLFALMLFYRIAPSWHLLALPLLTALVFAAALGAGLWLTALNVRYRDFRFLLPFIVQLGLYLSPVAFTSDVVPERWKLIYLLNPMVGVIDGFRWSLLSESAIDLRLSLVVATIVVVALLISGVWYFRRTEKTFADVI
jgi:homopolymeric O-antigen transport system permease protein